MIKYILIFLITFNLLTLYSFSQDFSLMPASQSGQKRREELKKHFLTRLEIDYKNFTKSDLKELEDLYQIANIKSHSHEAKEALIKIINDDRFKNSNRTGCAYLYLGTIDLLSDNDKIEYLNIAIQTYNDCWYGDGVQVGAYARYILGRIYYKQGQTALAYRFFDEISDYYPDSIDHSGNLLKDKIVKLTQKKIL